MRMRAPSATSSSSQTSAAATSAAASSATVADTVPDTETLTVRNASSKLPYANGVYTRQAEIHNVNSRPLYKNADGAIIYYGTAETTKSGKDMNG